MARHWHHDLAVLCVELVALSSKSQVVNMTAKPARMTGGPITPMDPEKLIAGLSPVVVMNEIQLI